MTTRARSTRLLLTCVFVALACATRFPCARAAEVSERERGGAEVSTRGSDRFGRLRRFFGGKDLPPSAAAVAAEVDDAPKHHPAAAKELGISVSEFAARGLEPELPPHNVTHERRERRQLGELEGWIDARATWYGGPNGAGPDGMSIYTGSCGYGKALGNHFISAWYVPRPRRATTSRTAVRRADADDAFRSSDTFFSSPHPNRRHTSGGYDWGLTDKCGQCFEVMCVDGATRGKDWSELGPWAGCHSAGKKSVTVKISDSCPCHHPNSSNKRWCCGDRTHLDLSYAAFDQIAIRHRGVVDLKVRPADCGKQGVVAFYQ